MWVNRGGTPGPNMFEGVLLSAPTDPVTGRNRLNLSFVMDVDADGQDEVMVPTVRTRIYCGGDPDRMLPSGDYAWWCGDEFDAGPADDWYDHSVFKWDAYKFREQGDGSYPTIRVPTTLEAPVRMDAYAEDWARAVPGIRSHGDGLQDVSYMMVNQYGTRSDGARITFGFYLGFTPEQLGPYVTQNRGSAPDLLVSATNGLGATATWSHQPLSRPDVPQKCDQETTFYTNNDGARSWGYVFFTSSMWTVSEMDVSNGAGGTNATCYRYEDAMLNVQGRGFQGFKKITAEERLPPAAGEVAGTGSCGGGPCSANNLITATEFNQEFPLTNRVKKVTVRRGSDGARLAETRYWWQDDPGYYAGRNVFLSGRIEEKYDLTGGELLSKALSVAEQDQLNGRDLSGEVKRSCNIVEDRTRPETDDRRMTVVQEDRVFDIPDETNWWPDKLLSRTTTMDFRTAAFDPEAACVGGTTGCMPMKCPELPATPNAKVQGARYTWFGVGAAAGSKRKVESEALYGGSPPTAAETPACFPTSTSAEARSCFQYDQFGNPAVKKVQARDILDAFGDAKTLTTSLTSSVDGYFTRTETNPAGHIATVVADATTGRPIYVQSVQGGPATTTQYDVLGRVLEVATEGTKPATRREIRCEDLKPSVPSCAGFEVVARAAYQAGAPITLEYLDVLGRVVRSVSEGFDGTFVVQADVAFNERGIKVSEYAPYRLAPGVTKYETRFGALDALGRIGRREVDRNPGLFAPGQGERTLATDYAYRAFTTSVTVHKPGASGQLEMSRTYDARGRLVETTQRVAGPGSNESVTQYWYSPAGALTNIRSGSRKADLSWAIDPATIDLGADYDNFGRKTEVRDPDRGKWNYRWDGLGRLRFQTDARGDVTETVYDEIGRLKERTSTANGETPIHAAWTWDLGQKGVLNRVDANDGYSVSYTYDSLLRPWTASIILPERDALAIASRPFDVEYGYDRGTGWLKAKRYPGLTTHGGENVAFDYDDRGFLVGETALGADYSRGKEYRKVAGMDERGQVTAQDLGNGVVENVDRDASTGITQKVQATMPNGSLVRATEYTYDHFLNLASQDKTLPPAEQTHVTETFTYDDLQRIRTSSRAWVGLAGESPAAQSYGYDDLGNISSKTDYASGYMYGSSVRTPQNGNAGPHAVAHVTKVAASGGGTATFTYDANGNLVEGDGRKVDFDLMNRPVRVCSGASPACAPDSVVPGPTSEFSYAPDGARYREVVAGAVDPTFGPKTVYFVDGDYELTVWPPRGDRTTGETEERTYLGGSAVVYRRAAGSVGSVASREVRYQHKDRLGSVDAVTTTTPDGAATVELLAERHGFDPWGKPRSGTWTSSQDRLNKDGDNPEVANDPTTGVSSDRGFTGHEHLDVHYLIHMNGRVYDYRLGRFLSVDPIISNPLNSQSINPYSYIGNNPLSGVDPTGYRSICAGTGSASNCTGGPPDPNEVVAIKWTTTTKSSDGTTTTSTRIQWLNGADGAATKAQPASPPDVKSSGNTGRLNLGDFAAHLQGSTPSSSRLWGGVYGMLTAQLPFGIGTLLPNLSNDPDFVSSRWDSTLVMGFLQGAEGIAGLGIGTTLTAASPATGPGAAVLAPAGVAIDVGSALTLVTGVVNAGVALAHIQEMRGSGGGGNGDLVTLPDNRAPHIFRDAPGHVSDTPANRQMLTNVANDPSARLGTDRFGNTWAARINADGTQTWVQIRNGQITNGGVNQTPRPFHPDTGLSGPHTGR